MEQSNNFPIQNAETTNFPNANQMIYIWRADAHRNDKWHNSHEWNSFRWHLIYHTMDAAAAAAVGRSISFGLDLVIIFSRLAFSPFHWSWQFIPHKYATKTKLVRQTTKIRFAIESVFRTYRGKVVMRDSLTMSEWVSVCSFASKIVIVFGAQGKKRERNWIIPLHTHTDDGELWWNNRE